MSGTLVRSHFRLLVRSFLGVLGGVFDTCF